MPIMTVKKYDTFDCVICNLVNVAIRTNDVDGRNLTSITHCSSPLHCGTAIYLN